MTFSSLSVFFLIIGGLCFIAGLFNIDITFFGGSYKNPLWGLKRSDRRLLNIIAGLLLLIIGVLLVIKNSR
jgi:hypothetical protein